MTSKQSAKRIENPTPLHRRILDCHGSVRTFCYRADVTRPYFYRMNAGGARPGIDLAATMARLLGLTLDEFLTMLGPSPMPTPSQATKDGIRRRQERERSAAA